MGRPLEVTVKFNLTPGAKIFYNILAQSLDIPPYEAYTGPMTNTECLDSPSRAGDSECHGAVEYRMAMSPTGVQYPRCDRHYDERYKTQQRIVRNYGGSMFYDGSEDY